MAFALIASAQAAPPGPNDQATTSGINTTGADLIVAKVSYNWAGTGEGGMSDNKSNDWTPLTEYGSPTAFTTTRIYYCYPATVGSNHVFYFQFGTGGLVNIQVLAFSGAKVSPFDQENGNASASASTIQPGSVTPSENNELVVAGASIYWGSSTDIDGVSGGFTLQEVTGYSTAINFGGAIAYLIQTTATAANPTFSWSGGGSYTSAAVIATFKARGGSPWNYYAQQ